MIYKDPGQNEIDQKTLSLHGNTVGGKEVNLILPGSLLF